MNKDLLKMALIGVSAGFCLSAQTPEFLEGKEIAMTKCTRDADANVQKAPSNGTNNMTPQDSNSDDNDSAGSNGSEQGDNQSQSSSSGMKAKRKSAAQKVVQSD